MQVTQVTEGFSLDNIVPFFQPIIDISNGAVWRYECLMRLLSTSQPSFLPTDLLHLIERQHTVSQLTQTIFNRSANYFRNINVAWNINLSFEDMSDPSLRVFMRAQLQDYPNPQRIALEITANNALQNPELFTEFAFFCQTQKIDITIDHFDPSSTKAEQLLALPIHAIKISAKYLSSAQNAALEKQVSDVLSVLQERRLAVIAEHIETASCYRSVLERGIKYGQGFYFSQPKAVTD
ncbi:MAG: EAL domain-containing protein [Paraglaciecola sp.]|nr:EAL domain-containing protein [Paraglaciecola sp.]NCT47350.1 EAL domain-containing protein [Paraglaciecola sp.]